MKLERIHLHNFRCFSQLTVEFDPKLTVIIADNGAGKTAILDAIAIGFGRYLTKLPGITGRTIKHTDLHINESEQYASFMLLAWEARGRENEVIAWAGGRKRDSAVNVTAIQQSLPKELAAAYKQGLKQIDAVALRAVRASEEGDAFFLPVIAYYGTNRAIRDEVKRRRGFKKQFSRFEALADALEPDSRFRAAFEWFNAMEDQERRERELRRDFDYRLPELQHVRTAIVRMLPVGFSNPRIEIHPLRFVIDRLTPDGVTRTLRVSQLSDGYRVVLGLVMDLARRMAHANSRMVTGGMQVMNPLDLPAIALIDEVDLHLHPAWQQRVLADLMRTFRGTQFIVTTHSPQVLSTVKRENIRVLFRNADGQCQTKAPNQEVLGLESTIALNDLMGVNPIPPIDEAQLIANYTVAIENGQHDSANGRELRTKLLAIYGAAHPVLIDADRLIRFQGFKLRQPPKAEEQV